MNFFKIIFGIPLSDDEGLRSGNDFPNNFPQGGWEMNNDDNDEDDLRSPGEIEKHFDKMQNDFEKIVKMFGFNTYSDMQWKDENSDYFPSLLEEPRSNKPTSLRDSCFKTPEVEKSLKFEDKNLDGKVTADEVVNYLNNVPGMHNESDSVTKYSPPKIYSKSVFIREIRRPDGSVETIKKVVDHTGKEETTITQNQIHNPEPSQNVTIVPKEDVAGISLLRKFFPF